ncbi:4-(cytidine 5'-diphospho)-2-C-methyl-D-erythritol kinase [Alicyclobacillus dauci]|uniref:4-diphosphocytidyl-2-C-methyl-D-erythritol kinase n=1 Tax=Alicyclobacillus dauci TaxID=1475485 RepID=A0ABY6Z5N2_9BACL|nr:4-(cytidine 5'-diphospho)-2-C-methyl-D-erythritol kinase [Alicyclobacillus dauci]WAH37325.1 4-(cytidine 5'-diphospho)-2-C-methyl-D-erythritol kinase [Alicyclobacillus dauci]
MLLERAYAKINLTLDVLGRRPDGYHEVDMVMQSIDLSDLVWLDKRYDGRIVLETSAAHIPTDDRNLCVQAAKVFFRHTGIQSGVHINLEKNIPVAAGLAGGSSDAAAVLRGLNRLFGTERSLGEIAEMAAEIGSDVPFCVYGGTAIAQGRGERLTHIPHQCQMQVLLIHPRMFVSTGEIYQALEPGDFVSHTTSLVMKEALQKQDVDAIPKLVANRLQRVTFSLYPEVAQLADKVETVTRTRVHMSGSGPTLFCLAPTVQQANRMYNALRGIMRDVYMTHFVTNPPVGG